MSIYHICADAIVHTLYAVEADSIEEARDLLEEAGFPFKGGPTLPGVTFISEESEGLEIASVEAA